MTYTIRPNCTSRRVLLVASACIISAVALLLLAQPGRAGPLLRLSAYPEKAAFPTEREKCAHDSSNSGLLIPSKDACSSFPQSILQDIQVTLKTGIGDRDQAQSVLNTYAACISNILIVSDAKDKLAGHQVHDVLADLPSSYASDPDWPIYKSQQQALANGETIEKNHEGWKLDKFKFLPMVEKAYVTSPNAKWYFFIESDIYVFWDTLIRALEKLDSSRSLYMGSPAPVDEHFWMAYGGAGIVLSNKLVHDLIQKQSQPLGTKYEDLVRGDCCGDTVLGQVIFKELGIRIGHVYPSLSGDELPANIPRDKWCKPLISLHRVHSEQMEKLWNWERCRPFTESPITYSTMLDYILTPVMSESGILTEWNNGAETVVDSKSSLSAAACADKCARTSKCLQWSYFNRNCKIAETVGPGGPAEKGWVSGWDLKKLKYLGYNTNASIPTTCSRVAWPIPEIKGG